MQNYILPLSFKKRIITINESLEYYVLPAMPKGSERTLLELKICYFLITFCSDLCFYQILTLIYYQVGSDGGRHAWYKWLSGQQPEGTSMTISISLYDCTLLSVQSMPGTPRFEWAEPKPNSDRVTRVLGEYFQTMYSVIICG